MSYPISVNLAVFVATILPTLLLLLCRPRKLQGTMFHFLLLSGLSCFLLGVACRGIGFFSPVFVVVAFCVTIALFIVSARLDAAHAGPARAKPIIWCTAGIVGLVFLTWFNSHFLRLNNLLAKHPQVSLVERLQHETEFREPIDVVQLKNPFTGRLSLRQADRLADSNADRINPSNHSDFENEFEAEAEQGENRHLGRSLRALLAAHHSIEQQFRMSAGFGRERTLLMPYSNWRLDVPEAPLLPPQSTANSNHLEYTSAAILKPEEAFNPWHRKNVISFASPSSLGLVSWSDRLPDLSVTVGFQKHAMRKYPDTSIQTEGGVRSLRINSMLLVSLLKHRTPAVYVSENLPNMKELDSVPTRQPNSFESEAVARLMSGEELVVDRNASEIQMVGAIRAAFQCLECHQLPRGTLLGAFSYRLSPISNQEAQGLEAITLSTERGD